MKKRKKDQQKRQLFRRFFVDLDGIIHFPAAVRSPAEDSENQQVPQQMFKKFTYSRIV